MLKVHCFAPTSELEGVKCRGDGEPVICEDISISLSVMEVSVVTDGKVLDSIRFFCMPSEFALSFGMSLSSSSGGPVWTGWNVSLFVLNEKKGVNSSNVS